MHHLWPYQPVGHPQKPAIICLHGFMGSGSDWISIVEQWTDRFFCLLPDLPGHGRHVHRPLSEPLTLERVANELYQFVERLELDRVGLLGYSLGGRVALYTAVKYPGKFSSLILESANPGLTSEPARQERADLDDRRAKQILIGGIDAFVQAWYDLPLFNTLHNYPSLLNATKSKRITNDPRWAAKIVSQLSPGRQPPLWGRLGTLLMPVLLVAGELDSHYTAVTTKMAQKIPSATIKIIVGAGHNTHLERPVQFTKVCLQRLSDTLE